jgi:hypothetical protein
MGGAPPPVRGLGVGSTARAAREVEGRSGVSALEEPSAVGGRSIGALAEVALERV